MRMNMLKSLLPRMVTDLFPVYFWGLVVRIPMYDTVDGEEDDDEEDKDEGGRGGRGGGRGSE